jgi:hypothetical protein
MKDLLTKIIELTEKQGVTLTLETLESIRDEIHYFTDDQITDAYDKGFDAGVSYANQEGRAR